jgi:hypothetical protein
VLPLLAGLISERFGMDWVYVITTLSALLSTFIANTLHRRHEKTSPPEGGTGSLVQTEG